MEDNKKAPGDNSKRKPKSSTPARKKLLLQALKKARGYLAPALEAAGVPSSTYYDWRDRDKRFAAKVDQIEEERVLDMEAVLAQMAMKEHNITAVIYFLNNKGRKRGWGVPYNRQESQERTDKVLIEVVPGATRVDTQEDTQEDREDAEEEEK